MQRTTVAVHGTDPVSQAGVASQLGAHVEVDVVAADRPAAVAVLVTDTLDEETLRRIRACRAGGTRPVLVIGHVEDAALLTAVTSGVCAVVRRTDATPERLVATVRSVAAGGGSLPGDLLTRLLRRGSTPPRGGLTEREVAVLRLAADGHSTSEIAKRMAYSERTVKHALYDLTKRLHLRNRTHAVAYAMRVGVI